MPTYPSSVTLFMPRPPSVLNVLNQFGEVVHPFRDARITSVPYGQHPRI